MATPLFYHRFIRIISAALLCWVGLNTGIARAQTPTYDTVIRLMRAEQPREALEQAETYLRDHPQDPQMRFLKGVLHTQQGQSDTAQATFLALTQDYPELPEPHNNLAVLYAAQNQLDRARESLETAIRLHPSYATAYQNLGDVHVKLAAQAYAQSLRLDANNPTIPPRLHTLTQMLATPASGQ